MIFPLPGSPFLYPILDSEFSSDLIGDAKQLIRAGVGILQLRIKNQPKRTVYEQATLLAGLCSAANICLILNDYVDVANVTPVSGVHLGQEDFPVDSAREVLGSKIIGTSTHTAGQYELAQKYPVDYIAIGPVFETQTKPTPNTALGIRNIASLLKHKTKPVVAIGGIDANHFGELLDAGVDGIAVISALYRAGDLYGTASTLLDLIRNHEKV